MAFFGIHEEERTSAEMVTFINTQVTTICTNIVANKSDSPTPDEAKLITTLVKNIQDAEVYKSIIHKIKTASKGTLFINTITDTHFKELLNYDRKIQQYSGAANIMRFKKILVESQLKVLISFIGETLLGDLKETDDKILKLNETITKLIEEKKTVLKKVQTGEIAAGEAGEKIKEIETKAAELKQAIKDATVKFDDAKKVHETEIKDLKNVILKITDKIKNTHENIGSNIGHAIKTESLIKNENKRKQIAVDSLQ
jgi:hypothetical protein